MADLKREALQRLEQRDEFTRIIADNQRVVINATVDAAQALVNLRILKTHYASDVRLLRSVRMSLDSLRVAPGE